MAQVVSSESSIQQRGTEALWFVGGYTADMGGDAAGIGILAGRPDGSLELVGVAAEVASPSFLALDGDRVFAVAEGAGRLEAFTRTDATTLDYLGGAPVGGVEPCHVSVIGDTLIVSSYLSGSLGVIDAASFDLVQVISGEGSGPHHVQEGPHAHATFALDDTTVLSADLGADRIHVHWFEGGRLERTASLELPAGSGPRDFARHPSGLVYVLAELSLQVLVLEYADARLAIIGSFPIPGAETGDHAAGISLTADGLFAYVALRGSNRIAVFAVRDDGRTLDGISSVPSEGDWPRHHSLDGNLLHVANQKSGTVASFRIGEDGLPVLIATPTPVPSPTYLLRA